MPSVVTNARLCNFVLLKLLEEEVCVFEKTIVYIIRLNVILLQKLWSGYNNFIQTKWDECELKKNEYLSLL